MTEHIEIDILLVEDNTSDVELALRALRKHNLSNKVAVATDGKEALDFLFAAGAYADRASQPLPKAMFLDLKMPKLGGLDVLRQVRANPKTRRLPVVIMTASEEERDVQGAYELGVNSYVVKPMDFAQFAKVVADLGFYWSFTNHAPYL
jgi:two-component system response regulator